jgi:hypothetical protein
MADPQMNSAIDELVALVRRRYPNASFEVAPAEDDAGIVHLYARVDVEDPEEVADLTMDRMLEMQVEDGLPIYLIPLRTPERIAALRETEAQATRARSAYLPPTSPMLPSHG